MSSSYFTQSNGRAEVAVKKAKRMLMDNDGLLRALLQARNTPDPDCNISPAEVVFGRPIRDVFPLSADASSTTIRPAWHEAWSQKEDAMRTRMTRSTAVLLYRSPQHAHATICTSNTRRQSIPAKPMWFTP